MVTDVNVLLFPYRIPLITVFTDSAIMPQVVGDLDNQIPQFKFLCIFRRNPGKSYLSAYDVPGDRPGRVAVSVVIDGGNQRVVDISGILKLRFQYSIEGCIYPVEIH